MGGRRYRATLTCISGHIFDFTITPGPKAIAFADWDAAPTASLLSNPLTPQSASEPQPIPDSWRAFLAQHRSLARGWTLHDAATAFRTAVADGEFLVLAERGGDQFVLHRIEPPASTLFYLEAHDGTPKPIKGEVAEVLRAAES